MYLVTLNSGGVISKPFTDQQQALNYYNKYIHSNPTIKELHPFTLDNTQYYYSISNCIAVYNCSFEYIAKLTNINVNDYIIEQIQQELKQYINTWEPPF